MANVFDKISNLLTVPPRTYSRPVVREMTEGKKLSLGGNNTEMQSAKHGVTPEMVAAVRKDVVPSQVIAKLKVLAGQYRAIEKRDREIAARNPLHDFLAHLEEGAGKAIDGGDIGEPVKDLAWFRARRETEMMANRTAKIRLTRAARRLIHPFLPAAAERAELLLSEEMEADEARAQKYGIPADLPNELHRSLNTLVTSLRTLAESPVPEDQSYTPPEYWSPHGLIHL
jgi:hypothetical protein